MRARLILSLGLAFLASACGKKDASADADGSEKAPAKAETKSAAKAPASNDPVDRLRAELDASVWAAEVAAQEYERAFVSLWDAMRAAEDPSVPLAAFSFETLSVPELGEPRALGDDVTRRESRGNPTKMSPAEFSARVEALRDAGWKLEQSEFHHSKFEPGTPARSVVSFLLHLSQPQLRLRTAVHGKLRVTWAQGKDARGNHVPGAIEVRDLSVLERRGGLAFERVRTLEPRPQNSPDPRVQPVLLYDLDGDGLSEIVLAGANRVYWNRGNMKFEDGPLLDKPVGFITSAAFGDLDGDGDVDLLAGVAGAPPLFFEAQGPGKFPVEGRELAVLPAPMLNPLALTLGDIDGDGDLDAYVTQYKRPYVMGQMPTPYYDANDGFAAYLLVNDGKAVFEDRTEEAGLAPKRYRRTYSTSFLDVDDDHDLDLLVVSDFSGVDLHLNDGKGNFSDVTDDWVDERASFGMSFTQGDYDLDGRRDLYVVGMSSTTARRLEQLGLGRDDFAAHQKMRMQMAYGNRIYLGQADHHLRQAPFADALARTGWSWGSSSFDFDRDGDLDIYVANGNVSRGSAADYCTTYWRHDIYTGTSTLDPELGEFFTKEFDEAIANGVSWNGYEHNKLFVNMAEGGVGDGFSEQGWALGVALEDDSRAVVSDDLDGDGRVDLVVVLSKSLRAPQGELFHEKVAVLQNQWPGLDAATPNHWIGIRLEGKRSPIGARVRVGYAGKEREHEIIVGDSLLAQHAPAHLFGLGDTAKVDWVKIRWLDGHERKLTAPKADRWHQVGE